MIYACGIYYDNAEREWTELMVERSTFSALLESASNWIGKRRNAELSWAISVTKTGKEKNITEKLKKALNKKGNKDEQKNE